MGLVIEGTIVSKRERDRVWCSSTQGCWGGMEQSGWPEIRSELGGLEEAKYPEINIISSKKETPELCVIVEGGNLSSTHLISNLKIQE